MKAAVPRSVLEFVRVPSFWVLEQAKNPENSPKKENRPF
jgi:hypothetical protein